MTIADVALTIVIVLISIGLHEYAHAKMADVAGDPTPRAYGRVTLNLFNHLDPMGTLMIIFTTIAGFGIGWGRPVPMDPRRMGNPRWDHFWAVAAGPISNLLQAAVYAILLRLLYGQSDIAGALMSSGIPAPMVAKALVTGVLVNLGLCFFNLIPLGPLDGHWLVGSFLHDRARLSWHRWNAQVGGGLLLGLVLIGQLSPSFNLIGGIVRPFVFATARFLLGF